MAEFTMVLPQYGMGMQDGEIVRWLKQPGDAVEEGENLVEVEAAKTTVEVPSPVSGTLLRIIAGEGETIDVREPIAVIETG
ncbi:biotin/lipoyl-containing protein [Novosphingobium resinovorum]|jgi:pyruvate/2-oxoglutarate dehydrogenase complex dihydrolipoamide acyltransferase (E2) component|uniref:Biotin attachment protein n=1 Tax=Novosphingobium resinovorum TaxID=158500 RepID=A0A031JTP3_9SPHN|nr:MULTISPECIES: biotin/lipoyl-containing protein [Sphingomonadaceae]AOR79976.1 biotin attachment protein [Novosphingobium resinovorum]EJU11871.1 biotin/lipoyl attachment domain-containing protein [Sphingomonas sp. LH128]EZP81146.1 Biotin/lipoyl attachment domain-containing protein [Novosphingobium resinovorum]MBF7014890.1 biotin attachment protein [Novosphingobium sp. HR1a]WJM24633.1 biotin/lipoyl-containing protein [Novosphingobium resinovorum]